MLWKYFTAEWEGVTLAALSFAICFTRHRIHTETHFSKHLFIVENLSVVLVVKRHDSTSEWASEKIASWGGYWFEFLPVGGSVHQLMHQVGCAGRRPKHMKALLEMRTLQGHEVVLYHCSGSRCWSVPESAVVCILLINAFWVSQEKKVRGGNGSTVSSL